MAKPNVHTASRDAMLDAGIRAEIVDEIIRRRRTAGLSLESLGDIRGVGAATLERLGQALDFAPAGGDATRTDEADVAEAALQAGTEQAAALVVTTVQKGGRAAAHAAETVREMIEAGVLVTRRRAVAEPQPLDPRSTGASDHRSAVGTSSTERVAAFSRLLADLLQEQGRHNMEAMAALAGANRLDEVLRVQGEYLQRTLARMTELNQRWLQLAATSWPDERDGPN